MDLAKLNRLADELRRAMACPVDEVPDGWITRGGYQRLWGVSESVASKLLKAGVESGMVQMRKFRIKTQRGTYNTPHYKQAAKTAR